MLEKNQPLKFINDRYWIIEEACQRSWYNARFYILLVWSSDLINIRKKENANFLIKENEFIFFKENTKENPTTKEENISMRNYEFIFSLSPRSYKSFASSFFYTMA